MVKERAVCRLCADDPPCHPCCPRYLLPPVSHPTPQPPHLTHRAPNHVTSPSLNRTNLSPHSPSPPQLEAIINDKVKEEAPLFGFEQEYTMLAKGGHIYGEAGRKHGAARRGQRAAETVQGGALYSLFLCLPMPSNSPTTNSPLVTAHPCLPPPLLPRRLARRRLPRPPGPLLLRRGPRVCVRPPPG